MERRVNRTRSSSSIGSMGSKKEQKVWVAKRTASQSDLRSLEKQEETFSDIGASTSIPNDITEESSLKSEDDQPQISSLDHSEMETFSEIQEVITPPKKMSRSSSLDGKTLPRVVHRNRRTSSTSNIRRPATNYSEFDSSTSMEKFSAPQPKGEHHPNGNGDDDDTEDCTCIDCEKRRIQLELRQGVKETRGLLAERETESFTFIDHDHASEISMFASLHLGPFAAHIFEFILLALLMAVFISFSFPSLGIRKAIEDFIKVKVQSDKKKDMLLLYHLCITVVAAITDLILSIFTKKKYFRFFPLLVIQLGTFVLFAFDYFFSRALDSDVSLEFILLAEFFLILIHFFISVKALKHKNLTPKRHRSLGRIGFAITIATFGFSFLVLLGYYGLLIMFRVQNQIQTSISAGGDYQVSLRNAIYAHVAMYGVFAITDFITSLLSLSWTRPMFLNTRFYRQAPFYTILIGTAINCIMVLYYDLGGTVLLVVCSLELCSIVCFFLMIRTWSKSKPGVFKVVYHTNNFREAIIDQIVARGFNGYQTVSYESLLKKDDDFQKRLWNHSEDFKVLTDFDLETDVLSSGESLETDSQFLSVCWQLFLSVEYTGLLRKQASAWLQAHRFYKETDLESDWNSYCRQISKKRPGDFLSLIALANVHCARIVVLSNSGLITVIAPDNAKIKRSLLLVQSKSIRSNFYFESVKPKLPEEEPEYIPQPNDYQEYGMKDVDHLIEIKPENTGVTETDWNVVSAKLRKYSKFFHIGTFFLVNLFIIAIIWLPQSPLYNNMVRTILALSYTILFIPMALLAWKVRKVRDLTKIDYKRILVVVTTYREEDQELMTTINSIRSLDYNQNYLHLMVIQDEYKYNNEKTEIRLKKLLYSGSECRPHKASFRGNIFWGFEGKLGNSEIMCTLYVKEKNMKKRNSMLFAMNYLKWWNQIHSEDGLKYEYCFMIDSDTAVDPPSLKQLVYEMNRRSDIASCCGETEVRETEEGLSWIQKVQKWEYWASHNINKNFQSAFGSVTCLPGCFSLHRVDDLVSNNYILEQFERSPSKGSIVESNLLELGEDRYLTLLLLIWHCLPCSPRKTIKYFSRAHCTTAAPRTWEKYRNQRRRWNNSTYMNIIDFLPALMICKDLPAAMKYQTIIEFLGVYLNLAMNLHLLLIIIQSIIQIAKGHGLGATNWVEITMSVIWIVVQLLLALRHKKSRYIPHYFVYVVCNPFISIYLSFFCYQRLDDFNWGTR